MNNHYKTPTMNQKIFDIGLSKETISLYLLCCGLVDVDQAITTKNLRNVWNGAEQVLRKSLESLEKRNVLFRIISDRQDNNAYRMTDVKQWDLCEQD